MSRIELYPWARRLLLCLGANVKGNAQRYSEAGKWFDAFYDVEHFWELRSRELHRLQLSQGDKDGGIEKFKLEYLDLMIRERVYVPFDSLEFWLMVADKPDDTRRGAELKCDRRTQDMFEAVKLGEAEFAKWMFENVAEYRENNMSVAGFAFLLENVVKKAMQGTNLPSIAHARDCLRRCSEFVKEPFPRYRFKDAMDSLFWRCSATEIMSEEDAKRVAVGMWLISDPTTESTGPGITKFETWTWDRGSVARCYLYYEVLLWNLEISKTWLSFATKAHEVLSIADDLPEGNGDSSFGQTAKSKETGNDAEQTEANSGKSIADAYRFALGDSVSALKLVERGEGHTLEFKETLEYNVKKNKHDPTLRNECLKTVAAFLNSDGGTLLIGVRDDGDVIGIERDLDHVQRKNRDGFELHVRSLMRGHLDPDPLGSIRVGFEEAKGVTVCRIDVDPVGIGRVIHLDGGIYVRDGNMTVKLTGRNLTDWIQHRRAT